MKLSTSISALLTLFLPLPTVHAFNMVLSNDDGWAEMNIRTLYNTLVAANHSVLISAPAHDRSGAGSHEQRAQRLGEPCQFDSCPVGSPAEGYMASDPRINYVNSYPASAMKYGINVLSPKFFHGEPDIALSGPNVENNFDIRTRFSGTIGAASKAAKLGVPAISFSGASGHRISYTKKPAPLYSQVYSNLSLKIVETLLAAGPPYLPAGIFLDVNYKAVDGKHCSSAEDFKFVLTRIWSSKLARIFNSPDVPLCGRNYLEEERQVMRSEGCYATISVVHADSKMDAEAVDQAFVQDRLRSILSCPPDEHGKVKELNGG